MAYIFYELRREPKYASDASSLLFDISEEVILVILNNQYSVKSVLSGHPKIDKTNILVTIGSLKKVESIAECSHWSILRYF